MMLVSFHALYFRNWTAHCHDAYPPRVLPEHITQRTTNERKVVAVRCRAAEGDNEAVVVARLHLELVSIDGIRQNMGPQPKGRTPVGQEMGGDRNRSRGPQRGMDYFSPRSCSEETCIGVVGRDIQE